MNLSRFLGFYSSLLTTVVVLLAALSQAVQATGEQNDKINNYNDSLKVLQS